MKFFITIIILVSSCLTVRLAYPDDVQDIPEPSVQLYYLYSIPHILWPRSAAPSISSSTLDILVEDGERFVLLISSPGRLYSRKVDIPHACEHGPYIQHLSISERFPNCISGLSNHDTVAEYPLSEHGIDIWSPKLYGHSFDSHYVNSFDISHETKTCEP